MNDRDCPSLPRLLKHYEAISPSTPLYIPPTTKGGAWPSGEYLSLPFSQAWIVQNFLRNSALQTSEEVQNEDKHDEQFTKSVPSDGQVNRLWRRVFWKRIITSIEEGFQSRQEKEEKCVEEEEIHTDILQALLSSMSDSDTSQSSLASSKILSDYSSSEKMCRRIWSWGLLEDRKQWNSVTTVEDGRMISHGTTGLRSWKASIALSNHLLANSDLIGSDEPVLELGAGVGLLSLVIGRMRQKMQVKSNKSGFHEISKIVSTDVDELALEQLGINTRMNGLSQYITVRSLDWKSFRGLEHSLEPQSAECISVDNGPTSTASNLFTRQATTIKLRTTTTSSSASPSGAGLILGADVVYDPHLAFDLARVIQILLAPRRRFAKSSLGSPYHSNSTGEFSSTHSLQWSLGNGHKFEAALIACTVRQESTWLGFLKDCRLLGLRIELIELEAVGKDGTEGIVGAEGWENEGDIKLVRLTAGLE